MRIVLLLIMIGVYAIHGAYRIRPSPISTPPPPLGLSAWRDDGRVLLSWSQQSDANVVCIGHTPAGTDGCYASLVGIHLLDLPDAPDGSSYFVHEWYRDLENVWTSYGEYGPATLPYYARVPLVVR